MHWGDRITISSTFLLAADGRLLVGAAGGSAWIWDVLPGFKPYQIQLYPVNISGNLNLYDQFVTAATLSPDNGLVAIGTCENTIYLYHRTSGVLLKELKGHSNSIHRLRFSPNGRFLLASDQDGTLVVWDVQTGRRISSTSDHAGAILGLNFNQDESLSAWTGGTVWTLKLPLLDALHSARISHGTILAASPLGDLLAVNTPYQVSLFDAQTGEYIDLLEGEAEEPWVDYQFEGLVFRGFNEAAFSEDGTSLITKAPGGEWLYEQAETGAFKLSSFLPADPLNPFTKVVASPNGIWEGEINLLWGANVALVDPRVDRTIHSMSFSGKVMPSSLVFSPDSRLMIIGQSDGRILLVDVETFDIVTTLEGHRGSVDHLVFSPNGRYLISGSADGTVRVWGVESEKRPIPRFNVTTCGEAIPRYGVPAGQRLENACSNSIFNHKISKDKQAHSPMLFFQSFQCGPLIWNYRSIVHN
jgi:WD40 repeat protein